MQDQPGKCPKCGGMELEPKQVPQDTPSQAQVKVSPVIVYGQLFIVILLILILASAISLSQLVDHSFQWEAFFRYSMAGFFIFFSLLKFIDIKGFAEGFSTYDLLAKKWPAYGYIYPYLELGLGIFYLINLIPLATNIATVIMMGLASLGVAKALSSKRQLQCACLGTVLKVPLSKVTLIEDIAMVAMAGIHIGLILFVHDTMTMTQHNPNLNLLDGFILSLLAISSLVAIIYIQYTTKDSHS